MKYIRLFENFEEGHKFDLLDLFTISPSEVEELFFKELNKRNPDLENIQVFLDSGLVDVNAKDNYDRTPLHMAAGRNSLALAKLLISSGADVNAKGYNDCTPLHWAAGWNSLEVAEFLISSGADVNAKDNNGDTPLHFTKPQEFYHRYEGVIELLISSGADEKIENNDGETYLDVED